VVSGSPQALVKIMSTPRGMSSIRERLDYITQDGQRTLVDDTGQEHNGRDEVRDLADAWQVSGSYIPAYSDRREAFHLVLDMPAGTDPDAVRDAAMEVAAHEFAGHEYAWVLHTHQGHPHVHLLVKVEGRNFKRLDPKNADVRRWRQGFAAALRTRGVRAEHSPRLTHGNLRDGEPIWMVKARATGTLRHDPKAQERVRRSQASLDRTLNAWGHIHNALASSPDAADRALAWEVQSFLAETPMVRHMAGRARIQRQQQAQEHTQSRSVSQR
jgi:hypothetical protein